MAQRCTDPHCPAVEIENHAHMTQAEQDELVHLVVKAMTEDLPADGDATTREDTP